MLTAYKLYRAFIYDQVTAKDGYYTNFFGTAKPDSTSIFIISYRQPSPFYHIGASMLAAYKQNAAQHENDRPHWPETAL